MSIQRIGAGRLVAALTTGTMFLVGIATFSIAQVPEHQRRADEMQPGHAFKASELIGQSVYTAGDQEKGKVKDLMLSPDGRVEYAAVSFGGFLGIGDKLFAVPLDAIHLEWKDNKIHHARVDVTEESIKQRQGFDDNHWPERADRGFVANQPGRITSQPPATNR
jgi:sporulation protein YlmC with PRC-barrel domain